MDFSKADIVYILKSMMPNRFAEMKPSDFELFIAQLFEDMGYTIEQVKHGSDFGADIIANKGGKRTAIQVKRYSKKNKVSVSDMNQAIGAKQYYNCDKVVFITTSDYSNSSRELAKKTNVETWNWNYLQKIISVVYLDGKHYHEYFKKNDSSNYNKKEQLVFQLNDCRSQQIRTSGNQTYSAVLFSINIKNEYLFKSHEVHVVDAIFIDSKRFQHNMDTFLVGSFQSGIIYPGCTVEVKIIFDSSDVPKVNKGDYLILDLIVNGVRENFQVNIEKDALLSPCFIATVAFGTTLSDEVSILKKWRDLKLKKSSLGRLIISIYYKTSPPIARWLETKPGMKKLVRAFLIPIISLIKKTIKYKE